MDAKLKKELIISLTDFAKKIVDKKITLKEAQQRVAKFNAVMDEEKLAKLQLFVPKKEDQLMELKDYILISSIRGLQKL
jgi:hypothetical protein